VLGWMSTAYGVGSALVGLGTIGSVATAVSKRVDKVTGIYDRLSKLPGRLRVAGGKPSKPADIGTRGAPRAQPRAQQNAYVDLPQRPGGHLWENMSGSERLVAAAQTNALGRQTAGQIVTPNMLRTFPNAHRPGFLNDPDYVSTLLGARGRTSSEMGQLNHLDLLQSGFTDPELSGLITRMRLPTSNAFARQQLQRAAAHFRRFRNTGDMGAFYQSTEALRLARDGTSTHQMIRLPRRN
jgi:hypothetical protein